MNPQLESRFRKTTARPSQVDRLPAPLGSLSVRGETGQSAPRSVPQHPAAQKDLAPMQPGLDGGNRQTEPDCYLLDRKLVYVGQLNRNAEQRRYAAQFAPQ